MRRYLMISALVALISAVVPGGAQASHCKDIFILSGDDSVREPTEQTRVSGFNVGSATCTGSPNNPDLPAVNYLTPGATAAWGVLPASISPNKPTGGTIKGATASWTLNDLRGRWETQSVTIGSASSVTLTATYVTSAGASRSQSITFTKAA